MPKVVIYTTPTCGYCRMAKDFFVRNNVSYVEVDVASDQEARKAIINATKQIGVPVIKVDSQYIIGFDRPKLAEALGIR